MRVRDSRCTFAATVAILVGLEVLQIQSGPGAVHPLPVQLALVLSILVVAALMASIGGFLVGRSSG